MNPIYNFIKVQYRLGNVAPDQLQDFVASGKITEQESIKIQVGESNE